MKKNVDNVFRNGLMILVGLLFLVASTETVLAKSNVVRLGVPPWVGIKIKSAVISEILTPLGFEVEQVHASAPIVYLSLSKNQVDINMSAWWPGQSSSFEPLIKKGRIIKLGQNLSGAISGFAVPDYVYEAGLKSDTQIMDYIQKLKSRVYCIEPGSGAYNIVEKAKKNNIYGLKDLEIKPSSTAPMLAQVRHATEKKKWIMFCGWEPHWMAIAFNMKILQDPKNLWGPNKGHSRVYTLASTGFVKNNPNLTRFFRQFHIDAKTQSQWIYQSFYKKQPQKQVADRWIATHLDKVGQWLKGVHSAEGEGAIEVLRAHYAN